MSHIIQELLLIHLVADPRFFILGIYPKGHKIKRREQIFIDLCLLHAKRSIALTWQSSHRPSIGQWLKEMSRCLPLEKITYTIKDKQEQFRHIWGPFINFLRDKDLSSMLDTARGV